MLKGLNLGEMKYSVPVLAVSLALEGKASHREMTSKLISDLCGTVVSKTDVEKSFDICLKIYLIWCWILPGHHRYIGRFLCWSSKVFPFKLCLKLIKQNKVRLCFEK